MALKDLDWIGLLDIDPAQGPKKDITFFLYDSDSAPVAVSCHKFLLAMVSPVFRRRFYGKGGAEIASLDIEGVSSESFRKVIEFIYQTPGSFSFLGVSPADLKDMKQLANTYEVKSLLRAVSYAEWRSRCGAGGLCQNCREEGRTLPGTLYCVECEEFLCGECSRAHARTRQTKGHAVQEVGGGGVVDEEVSFTEEEELRFSRYFLQSSSGQPRALAEKRILDLQLEIQDIQTHMMCYP